MCLAGIEVLCMVPLGSFVIWKNCTGPRGIAPWISWEDTHYNFSRVGKYPAFMWRFDSGIEALFEFNRWQIIICSFIFFLFFGFAEEARQNYKAAFLFIAARLGYFRETPRCVSTCTLAL
jgi:pheromone a factor receptor